MYSSRNYWSLSSRVSPFGYPRINLLPTSRGFSQVATSFFASRCQGIRRTPLLAWSKKASENTAPKCAWFGTSIHRHARCKITVLQVTLHSTVKDLMQWAICATAKLCRDGWLSPCRRVFRVLWIISVGGDDRDRTDDLRLAKPALSQLSYIPIGTHSAEPPASAAWPEGPI